MKQAVFEKITEADILKVLKLFNEALPEIEADKNETYKLDSAPHPQRASVLTSQCFQSLHHCCFLLKTYTWRQYRNILTTSVFLNSFQFNLFPLDLVTYFHNIHLQLLTMLLLY